MSRLVIAPSLALDHLLPNTMWIEQTPNLTTPHRGRGHHPHPHQGTSGTNGLEQKRYIDSAEVQHPLEARTWLPHQGGVDIDAQARRTQIAYVIALLGAQGQVDLRAGLVKARLEAGLLSPITGHAPPQPHDAPMGMNLTGEEVGLASTADAAEEASQLPQHGAPAMYRVAQAAMTPAAHSASAGMANRWSAPSKLTKLLGW